MPDEINAKMRTYLSEIYRLADQASEAESYVSTSALADTLMVTAPAANRMINRLKELNLLEHEPYKGIRLTESGTTEALKQLRKHRITEAFLADVMGFGWDEVYEEASRMSSVLGETLIQRMAEMTGQPTHCPHGEPIPTAAGTLTPPDDVMLTEAPIKTRLLITRVRTRETDRLQYLQALGLVPGTAFEVYHAAPFDGPMQLKLNGEFRIIGYNLAELLRVRVT